MKSVKCSVVISGEQDAFLDHLETQYGLNRSQTVRIALDKLMRDPVVFVGGKLIQSAVEPSSEYEEATR